LTLSRAEPIIGVPSLDSFVPLSVWCRMLVRDIFLARYAEPGPDGLFTVVGGGIDRINTGGFPWSWGLLFLIARVRLTREEALGEHVFAVEREAPDGRIEPIVTEVPLLRMRPPAEVGPDGNVGLTMSLPMVNSLFSQAGVYRYRYKIDGQEVGVAELLLAESTQDEQSQ
jgi:hypothetical protein